MGVRFCCLVFLAIVALTPHLAAEGVAKASAEQDNLVLLADEIAKDVEGIRGLPVLGPVKKGVKNREELREALILKLAESVTDEQVANEAKVYKRLGLLDPEIDYKQMLLDLLTEQIAGFYDQTAKELYVMAGIPLALQRPAIAHELYHAIQDQHFDIVGLQGPFSSVENGDFALARAALIEGDATVVMIDFSLYEAGQLPQGETTSLVDIPMVSNMLRELQFEDLQAIESMLGSGPATEDMSLSGSALARTPPVFRKLLVFPYFAGMRFIILARTGKTWKDVDAIYRRAPVSTEQIIHIDRYFAGDMPTQLSHDPKLERHGFTPIYDTVLGEFQLELFLGEHLPESSQLKKGVVGWGGDRLIAYEKENRVVVNLLTSWDSWKDAKEAYHVFGEQVRVRYPDAQEESRSGRFGESRCWRVADGTERIYLERWGDMVLYIEGAPSVLDEKGNETSPVLAEARDSIWDTTRRQTFSEAVKEARARNEKATPKPPQ